MPQNTGLTSRTKALAVAVGVATFMAIGTIALFGFVVSLSGEVAQLNEKIKTLSAQHEKVNETFTKLTLEATSQIAISTNNYKADSLKQIVGETEKQISRLSTTYAQQLSHYPKKSAVDAFRREIYNDLNQLIFKTDATTDELDKIPGDNYESFMRWAKSKKFMAAIRDFEKSGDNRGAIVIMPTHLKDKFKAAKDSSYSWD